jgi:hypothetical protein
VANEPKAPDDDEPVPRIPRSFGFKIPTAALFRIVMTGALLAMIIVARRPCADSVSNFVNDFDNSGGSARTQMPKPGNVDEPSTVGSAADYETLSPDMSEAEIKAAIERSKTKSRGSADRDIAPAAGSCSGVAPSAAGSGSGVAPGSGSATP